MFDQVAQLGLGDAILVGLRCSEILDNLENVGQNPFRVDSSLAGMELTRALKAAIS